MTPFWENKTLQQLTAEEWESLCDGCGKCCLHKLEDEDSGDIYYTNVACRLLDQYKCRCKDYQRRNVLIRDCVILSLDNISFIRSMPPTCAYRLVLDGQPLPEWHHLVSGDKERVHTTHHSIRGRVVDEESVKDYEDHIVDWPLEIF